MPTIDIATSAANTSADDPAALEGAVPARAEIIYVTDPICSHCWAMEPGWRKLLYHYGHLLTVRHLYGGLVPRWEGFADRGAGIRGPADVAPHWEEVVERYGQPIDPSVWLRDPLSSSFPASIAAHTVRLIAPEMEEAYLRRIRDALFLEARNIARTDVLIACAKDIGVDEALFAAAFERGDGVAPFEADLAELRELPVRGFPTLIISGAEGVQPWIMRGTQPYFRLERALRAVLGELPEERSTALDDVFAAYGSGTTPEFAEVLGLDLVETAAALRRTGLREQAVAGSAWWTK
jgi:predicted DsbA family dithiol-disulfide isomerase